MYTVCTCTYTYMPCILYAYTYIHACKCTYMYMYIRYCLHSMPEALPNTMKHNDWIKAVNRRRFKWHQSRYLLWSKSPNICVLCCVAKLSSELYTDYWGCCAVGKKSIIMENLKYVSPELLRICASIPPSHPLCMGNAKPLYPYSYIHVHHVMCHICTCTVHHKGTGYLVYMCTHTCMYTHVHLWWSPFSVESSAMQLTWSCPTCQPPA